MTTTGQQSLTNFYRSVLYSTPVLAELMRENVEIVALNGLSNDSSAGQPAADRLRRQADQLPEIYRRVLDSALTELGYS